MKPFFRNKRLKAVTALSASLVFSLAAVSLTSCDEKDTPADNTTTKTDNCAIANGNFEFFSDDDLLKLIVSPSGWSKSNGQDKFGNAANSSSKTHGSGIIDTNAETWKSVTTGTDKKIDIEKYKQGDYYDVKKAMDDAAKVWKDMSINDRLAFYDSLEGKFSAYNTAKNASLSLSDFEYYSDYTYSIDIDDVPDCENPGVHVDAKEGETGVLMISNHYPSSGATTGTAQKYTSSTTVSLDPGTAAELTMYVKTADLTYNDGREVNGHRGAYIGITHTAGGTTLEQMQIKNIDTESMTEGVDANGWVKYTVYVKACSYASSSVTVVLGLGQGSSVNTFEYVEGYAFFDDVDVKIIDPSLVPEIDETYTTTISTDSNRLYTTDTEAYKAQTAYLLDLSTEGEDNLFESGLQQVLGGYVTIDTALTETEGKNGVVYTTDTLKDGGIDKTGDYTGFTSWKNLSQSYQNNVYLNALWEDHFTVKDGYALPFAETDDLLLLLSGHGAAYTTTMESPLFTVPYGEYRLLSFWTKTSALNGYTGATVTLTETNTEKTTVLGALDTTVLSTVDLDDKEDIYSGWVQCFLFIHNDSVAEKDLSFTLKFSYGNTTISETDSKYSYAEGFAAFGGFRYTEIDKNQFSYAGTAGQSVTATLTGITDSTSNGFASTTNTDSEKIETDLANPSGHKGVYGGTVYNVPGENENAALNANPNAGLLNKKYIEAYVTGNSDWIKAVGGGASMTDALAFWDQYFGSATQPLLIANVVEQSYGFFGSAQNLSQSGYNAVSVRVWVSEGAKAYVYLVDTSDIFNGYEKTQSMTTVNVTYWYDDNGNICDKNPADRDFNAKQNAVFLMTDHNWLVINENSNWFKALSAADQTKYKAAKFANLANYEKDDNGNLLVNTKNGAPIVTYDYADDYYDDGVAYYAKDGKYYAYSNHTSEVISVPAEFTKEYARYVKQSYAEEMNWTLGENVTVTCTNKVESYFVVDGTNSEVAGKWVTVNFFIHTGDQSFPYRLEVFSGSRDGSVKNPAGTYVLFDGCNSSNISDNYAGLLSDAIKAKGLSYNSNGKLVNESGELYGEVEYYAYTFFDDPDFQRYDLSLDKNEVGNSYIGYEQSAYSEEITYFRSEEKISESEWTYSMFLNYSPMNQSVDADTIEEDPVEEEDNDWLTDPNFWMMLSSILLAVVLIIVLIIVATIRIVKRIRRKADIKENNNYNKAKRMHYIRKLNLQTEEESDETNDASAPSASENENPYED